MEDRVLVFDVWSDFAHFRRFETTASPLTYPFPTGTAIAGLLAAIAGLPRDSYYNLFSRDNVEFSVRILNPVKKIVIPINIVKTDEDKTFSYGNLKIKYFNLNTKAPTPYEFIKEPKYRIYVLFKNLINPTIKRLYEKLKQLLENHQTVYTPYLGISEMIANFDFIGDFSPVTLSIRDEIKDLHSVARLDRIKIIIEEGKRYGRETVPLYMDENRVVLEYCNVVYEANGKPLKIRGGVIYKVGDEHVSFL